MTEFVPPKPRSHPTKLSLVRRLMEARRCSISVLYDRSYDMRMGHVGTPLRDLYFPNQPELIEQILVKEWDRFPKSNLMNTMLELLLGESIFITNGALWRRQRRMIDPAFEAARIQDVFPLMRSAALDMGERLSAYPDGAEVPADAEMMHVTADIIFRTIYSRPFRRDEAKTIFHAFTRFQELAYARGIWSMAGIPDWLSIGRIRAGHHARVIRNLLASALDERLDAADGAERKKDILSSLLEARDPDTGQPFSRKELVDQIGIMFLAGHETSAAALGWALYLIAMRPDIQERMHHEAVAVFGDRLPEFRDIKHLRLTRDVFRETLRLYPPVSFIPRDATEKATMRDKLVKAGSILFVSPWLLHRHRKFWSHPDDFDPDRYLEAASKQSVRSAYIPFSAGPRVCLGAAFAMQEGVLLLAYLARHFRFEPVEGHVPVPVARLTLRSENGIRLRVFRRPVVVPTSAGAGAMPEFASAEAPAQCPFH
jgi:cytochrome P450